jgi:hypothetical protein
MEHSAKPILGLREKVGKLFDDHVQRMVESDNSRNEASSSKELITKCSCGGQIVRVTRTDYVYYGSTKDMILGPEFRDQQTKVVTQETYCETCKLMYHNSLQKE